MLNELLIVERGARQAGIEMTPRHPDIKDTRRIPTLLVQLDEDGAVIHIRPIPETVSPWTLRDGQHNSFPFVQPKHPLWKAVDDEESRDIALNRRSNRRREALLRLAAHAACNEEVFADWPGNGLLQRLRERQRQLASLNNTDAAVVPHSIERFVRACDPREGGDPKRLIREIATILVGELERTTGIDWIAVASSLLIGQFNKKQARWESGGGLLLDASGDQRSMADPHLIGNVSAALRRSSDSEESALCDTRCGLTGIIGRLIDDKFPQPNLPVLGQTYLFARNKDTPANERYDRLSTSAMPVGQDTAIRLSAAFESLTSDERRNLTWRPIPGEVPKQSDLLLAFVEESPNADVAGMLVEDDFDEDGSGQANDGGAATIAVFEKRTQRLIDSVQAKAPEDFTATRVRLAVFRKLDPANRKVIYSDECSVMDYHVAAVNWSAGERNIPNNLALPVLRKGDRKPRLLSPPHIAPLGLITFSKQLFLRNGQRPDSKKKEQVGITAADAFRFFLCPDREQIGRILRSVLARRKSLLTAVAHYQHMPESYDRRSEVMKKLDRLEALRTITLLGVVLQKLSRFKELYMSSTAFKLGQLLAAADIVHAGYCADVRGGDIPPSLLGNQTFAMAQSNPVNALAMLCRRWKPYDGWATKADRNRSRLDAMVDSKHQTEQQKGWDIKKALRNARDVKPLADELAPALVGCTVDDTFRAELLLGYIAGLPRAEREPTSNSN